MVPQKLQPQLRDCRFLLAKGLIADWHLEQIDGEDLNWLTSPKKGE